MSITSDLENLKIEAFVAFSDAKTAHEIENVKGRFLGKNGKLKSLLKELVSLPHPSRVTVGAEINRVKEAIELALSRRRAELLAEELELKLRSEALDVSLPGRQRSRGGLHPLSLTLERVEAIFGSMGFDLADGPEIESDWFSFTALNNPPNHPARSMQDTFYVDLRDEEGAAFNLRPHTSPMQLRYATKKVEESKASGKPIEIRVIAPGRTYRVDNDATHSPMFHQCEGLWLGENISFKDLKVVFTAFCRVFFQDSDLQIRFRPSFFPFTEPSAEIDIQFKDGFNAGKWLEVCGAGQVHPKVVANMGLNPEQHIGFAFGMGLDRLTMLRYGISDLRNFFDGDMRFLQQFG